MAAFGVIFSTKMAPNLIFTKGHFPQREKNDIRMEIFTHDFKMLRSDPFLLGFQIRKLQPASQMAGVRVVFFWLGISFFHFVREQDRKEKQQLSNFKQPRSHHLEQALEKLKSPFNNTLPFVPTISIFNNIHGLCQPKQHRFVFFRSKWHSSV